MSCPTADHRPVGRQLDHPPSSSRPQNEMLELKDVKKSFRQPDGTALPILDIAEFQVDAGEQMVIIGRSGCGKTTLLHVIAGISRPDSGMVHDRRLGHPR